MSRQLQPNPGKMKQFYVHVTDPQGIIPYFPRLYVEAKVDFADVRSGLRETCTVNGALETCVLEGDELWTEDMVRRVNPESIQAVCPPYARLESFPPQPEPKSTSDAESRFLSYVLRSYHVKLYRNFELNIYSRPGESLEDFQARCIDMLSEAFRRELYALQEVYNRSLEQIRETQSADERWAVDDRTRLVSQHRGEFHDAADRMTSLFINTELNLSPDDELEGPRPIGPDLDQRLRSLEFEARHAIGKLVSSYRQKALNIDDYIVHPNFRDIHLVRSCILWMPGEV